jgi:hypothetical protein
MVVRFTTTYAIATDFAVPDMDGRQMRLISYSGDQKLLQIR